MLRLFGLECKPKCGEMMQYFVLVTVDHSTLPKYPFEIHLQSSVTSVASYIDGPLRTR